MKLEKVELFPRMKICHSRIMNKDIDFFLKKKLLFFSRFADINARNALHFRHRIKENTRKPNYSKLKR